MGAGGRFYPSRVRLSEFWARMDRKFGATYAASYASDQVLATLSGRTVREALAAGEDTKDVWRAVCEAVPDPAPTPAGRRAGR